MKKLLTLLLLFCGVSGAMATTLHVEQLNSSDFAIAVLKIGKIVINGTTLEFYDRQGNALYTSDMASVGAVTFEQTPQSLLNIDADRYTVYPNPTHSILMVNGLEENTTLRLYNLDGQLIKSATGTAINVDDVPAGNYLLQFENQIVKIIKQ